MSLSAIYCWYMTILACAEWSNDSIRDLQLWGHTTRFGCKASAAVGSHCQSWLNNCCSDANTHVCVLIKNTSLFLLNELNVIFAVCMINPFSVRNVLACWNEIHKRSSGMIVILSLSANHSIRFAIWLSLAAYCSLSIIPLIVVLLTHSSWKNLLVSS